MIVLRLLSFLCVFSCAMSLTACGGAPKTTQLEADAPMVLDFSVRDETNSERLYRIDRDHNISFGGGFQARLGNTPWTGALSEQDRIDIAHVINQQDWFGAKIESTNDPKERVYRIDIDAPPGHRRFKVVGRNERVASVEAVLERICLRRLDPELQRLPEPGLQKRQ